MHDDTAQPSPGRVGGPVLRMLDANTNRAAEALRVLEDLARFVAGDGQLSAQAKRIRHALRETVGRADVFGATIAWRDTPGDPGTANKVDNEGVRSDLAQIAIAAGNRAAEALRVIEESLKLLAGQGAAEPTAWRTIERLRYDTYELAKRVMLALVGGGSGGAAAGGSVGPQWKLCVLISRGSCSLPWQETARRALEGGADCLQLREKDLPDDELLAAATVLRSLTRSHGAALVINDRVDIALLSGADGVHLGQDDLGIEHARRLAGRSLLVGVSTHSMDEAKAAVSAGANVCGVGAMFASSTKSRNTSGVAYLREYLADERTSRVPHLAIGGITPDNIGELAAAGCRGVAVSSAVCASSEPESVCRRLREALEAETGRA